jgi:hypothetical protein
MLVYHSRFLRRGEVWFDNEPDDTPVDWVLYRQRSRPVPGAQSQAFYTRQIALAPDPETLLTAMEPATVFKLKVAQEKDRTSCECCNPGDFGLLDELEGLWNQHVAAGSVRPLEPGWLRLAAAAGALDLALAREPSGRVLAWHAAFRDQDRARQLIIVSPYSAVPKLASRQAINRANCLLLWQTMLRLKADGVRCFDFGGWYVGTEDIRLLGMNAFKQGFGGRVVQGFQCRQILTLRAWALLNLARMLERFQKQHWETPVNATPRHHNVSPAF